MALKIKTPIKGGVSHSYFTKMLCVFRIPCDMSFAFGISRVDISTTSLIGLFSGTFTEKVPLFKDIILSKDSLTKARMVCGLSMYENTLTLLTLTLKYFFLPVSMSSLEHLK